MSAPRPLPPPQHFGLLLTATRAAVYLGVALSTFYEFKAADPTFPRPVPAPGRDTVRFYLREDLRAWARGLRKREEKAA